MTEPMPSVRTVNTVACTPEQPLTCVHEADLFALGHASRHNPARLGCACVNACMHVCMYACRCLYIYIYIYICIYMCIYTYITYMYLYMYMYIYIYMHMCACMHAYANAVQTLHDFRKTYRHVLNKHC